MKKIILTLFIVQCIFAIENCMCQWQWVNPIPNSSFIKYIKYADANTVYMTQEFGNIMKSTDKGVNWTCVYNDSTYIFRFIWFFNANTGLVSGYKNGQTYLLKTTNGGYNWNIVFHPDKYLIPCSIFFLNNNTGYLGCTDCNLYKTTNAGINWDSVFVSTDFNYGLSAIYFKDNNRGIVAGWYGSSSQYWGRVYKTLNGGLNWTSFDLPYFFTAMQFSGDTGYIFTSCILKTTNFGNSWDTVSFGINQWIQDAKFINGQTGIVVGGSSLPTGNISVSKTTNGGLSWVQSKPLGFYELLSVDGFGVNDFIAGGQGGSIIRSTNCGVNWISNTFNTDVYNQFSFPNENTGYVLAQYNYIRTTNGGANWTLNSIGSTSGTNTQVNSIKFFDSNTGYIFKDSLFKTTNGGITWTCINIGANRKLKTCCFINESTGFVIAYYNIYPNITHEFLEKTTNGGLSWQETQYADYVDYGDLYFFDENTGYSKTTFSTNSILKTTNGGINWTVIPFEVTFDKMYFLNSLKGFVLGQYGLYMTTNGGNNFIQVFSDSTASYYYSNMYFLNANTGFFTQISYTSGNGSKTTIRKTTNGGYNWNQYCRIGGNAGLGLIYFKDNNTGYLFGGIGQIMKTTNGGGFMGVTKIGTNIPSSFMLFQNYPNPFNPSSIIRFQIKDSRFVTLKVFDILGKEIATLVNEKQSPGTYEVKFDGSGLSSGVYFYKLEAGDFKEVKKMLMLK